ncbi:MAG TPA: heparan-alpha-glucosaminide N-acetyltransferase domain-containing protein [Candidatus Lokiarchaeia archaeon]|nr:heparan-alpha-glucosaminide N-acetyltransferase domain-containing protein [Candidatus Lokiarchaeia archaeon]
MPEEEKKKSSLRIRSIDLLRGLFIMLMIISHGFSYWLIPSNIWLFAIEGPVFGTIAMFGFVFISGVGFGYSWSREAQNPSSGNNQSLKSLSHTLALLLVAICYNVAYTIAMGDNALGIISWQILQCLAVCRLLSLLFIRVKKYTRFAIGLGLVAFGSLLLNLINFGHTNNLAAQFLFLILYKPLEYYPILIYFPIFLFGTVLGEDFNKMAQNPATVAQLGKNWFLYGAWSLFTGILLGLQKETVTPYNGRDFLSMLNTNPSFHITTYPLLFDINSYAWCFFYCGLIVVLSITLFYYLDLKNMGKNAPIPGQKGILDLYGRYSLTIFLGHYMAFLIPPLWDASGIWLPTLALVLVVWLAIWVLDKKGKGKYSLEFMLSIMGDYFYQNLKKKMEQ